MKVDWLLCLCTITDNEGLVEENNSKVISPSRFEADFIPTDFAMPNSLFGLSSFCSQFFFVFDVLTIRYNTTERN